MAISLHTAGTWAYDSSGSITVALPVHSTGDMLIVRVAIKSGAIATCDASTASSGWAKVGQKAGTTNSGNGTGSVLCAAFWKIATSAAEADPTIDFSQTNTQGGSCGMSYQKAAGESWVTPVGDGGLDEGTADTSHSATIDTHVSVTAGDLVDFFTGIRDDTTMTVPTITQTGVTFAAVVESPAAAGIDTTGADGAYDGGYRIANSGTSSAAAVVTGTLSTNEQGTSWMTRLRVEIATNAPAELASATGAAQDATTAITTTSGSAAAVGAAQTAQAQVGPLAGDAAATGAAQTASVALTGTADNAVVAVEAQTAAAGLTAAPGVSTATAAALDATVETLIGTNAEAGNAAATGTANAPAISLTVPAGNAAATGVAQAPLADVGGSPTVDAVTAAANAPAIALTARTSAAAAIAAAYDATGAIAAAVGLPSVSVAALNPTVQTSGGGTDVDAGLGSVAAAAYSPTVLTSGGGTSGRYTRQSARPAPPNDDDEVVDFPFEVF